MNLSEASSVVTVILGVITATGWLWSLRGWFLKHYLQAKENSDLGRKVAAQLIAKATSAERRADIHLYLITLTIESNTRKVQASIRSIGMGLFLVIFMFFNAIASRFLAIDKSDPLVIAAIISFFVLLISTLMAFWFSHLVSRLDDGWNEGFKKAIEQKIDKHLA